ncbi:MAG: protein translocase subunit SecD [Candidatus Gracilibacteria bacterium]|nr:protein translocase subunit SecD [Candidatus Gracilibacteria bacterium]MDD5179398.1 protein translocase subunit SecD [Candidatus Gracilibacteria bacterium]
MQKRIWLQILAILIVVGIFAVIDLPREDKVFLKQVPLVGETLANYKINLGLDLQGGTHLDYRVDTSKIPTADVDKVVAGVREVIERRVNKLGVAEPNIFESRVGDERHIVVELAGIKDIEQAKAIVGKTIQLEFKEQNTQIDPNEKTRVEKKAADFLAAITLKTKDGKTTFKDVFSDFEEKPKITMEEDTDWVWESDVSDGFKPAIALQAGEVFSSLIQPQQGDYYVDSSGSLAAKQGAYIVQLLAKEENVERVIDNAEERKASHILIAYSGAQSADAKITRSKEEAEKRANEILKLASAKDADFATLAKENSDDASAASNSGELGFFKKDAMVKEFSEAAFGATAKVGLLPEVVKTDFGYHIIKLEEIKVASTEKKKETRVKMAKAFFSTAPDGWKATGLTGQHFRRADVGSDPTTMRPIVNIYFTQTAVSEKSINWWQLIGYIVALAAGIAFISSALGLFIGDKNKSLKRDKIILALSTVILAAAIYGISIINSQIAAEKASVEAASTTETATTDEGRDTTAETDKAGVQLFAELTQRNLQKPIAIFLDGLPIIDTNGDGVINEMDPAYAPVVQSAITNGQAVISGLSSYEQAKSLVNNLNTGAIPAPVKLSGQYTVGATLGATALTQSLQAGILGLILVMIFMIFFYRLPGVIASFALVIYGVLLVAVLQFLGVVLTLAGIAGVILSIGMAVDANILIFERMKEELKLGKTLSRGVEDGFNRAWTSIRDSNASSLITCAILFWFGSSMIQGFALTLGVGIAISMFTAITVSRTFMRAIVHGVKNLWLYGISNR